MDTAERFGKHSAPFRATAVAAVFCALIAVTAPAGPVDGWYVNINANGTLISNPPGAFNYVLGPGANRVLADVGPYTLAVGSSLTFSGTVTNNVSTLLWNNVQFRWGILDSNGNPFHGISGINGDYTNYHGYWAGNPNTNPHPIYELTNAALVWYTISGVAKLGTAVLATGSAASSPPLGVYSFSITYQRLNTNQLLITADLNNSQPGVYDYHMSAVDDSVSIWRFDRVGMYFNPGVNSTGTLHFGDLSLTFSNSPLTVLVASDFDDSSIGREGWSATNSLGGAEPVYYSSSNGLYLGGISWVEPADGATTYYVAPAKFLGDQRSAYNGLLTFSLRRTGGGSTHTSSQDVTLGSSNTVLGFQFSAIPAVGSWFRFEIPLNENSGWTNLAAQRPATREEFLTTLGSLNRLRIRAEYTTIADASDLDMVTLWGQPSGALQPALALNVYPEIWISGAVGRTYRIEYKDDLGSTNTWQQLATVVLPTSPYLFTDQTSPAVWRRFYRAVLNP